MASSSLYRIYRPRTFAEVVGQKHVITALQQAIRQDRIAHAYLFCGTRGTGKTSLAKIFARAINCPNGHDAEPCNACPICRGSLDGSLLDIIETDAASNNSVDNIRRICDEVAFAPTTCKYKVYIIDEVHMLSVGAFNALLKTLEEPPEHIVFILATTDPQRIPATILSRCQRYDLRALSLTEIASRLRLIATENDIKADDSAIEALAGLAKGAMRDAISLLDQCRVSFSTTFSRDDVFRLVGRSGDAETAMLTDRLFAGDPAGMIKILDEMVSSGNEINRITQGLLMHWRNIMLCQIKAEPQELLTYPPQYLAKLKEQSNLVDIAQLRKLLIEFSGLLNRLRSSDEPRLLLEIALLSNCCLPAQIADEIISGSISSIPSVKSNSLPSTDSRNYAPASKNPEPDTAEQNTAEPDTAEPNTTEPNTAEPITAEPDNPSPNELSDQSETKLPEKSSTTSPAPAASTDLTTTPESKQKTAAATHQETITESPQTADTATAVESNLLSAGIWQKAEQYLNANGAVLLVLLLRNIKITYAAGQVNFCFTREQTTIYNEFMRDENQQLVKAALRHANNGVAIDYTINIEGVSAPLDRPADVKSEGITAVRQMAEQLNIPFTMEE